jgi:creatinine amidohydrolase
MRLDLSTWPEVEAYLRRRTWIVIPIGSTEQHGPNGPIGTDAICAGTLARSLGERLELLVAPTLAIGMAQHHMAFPGTISLRPETLLAVVRDVVESLARHGFTHCYFVNGHGGNIPVVEAAFCAVYGRGTTGPAPLRCRLANWWRLPAVRALATELYGEAEGWHATASEISLAWHAHPEAEKRVPLDPPVAPTGPIYDAEDFRRRYPDGRMGSNPGLSRAEHGARFHEVAVTALAEDFRSFVET